jgi:hypothetical protein
MHPVSVESSLPDRPIVPDSAAESELIQQHLPLVKIVVRQLAMSLSTQANPDDFEGADFLPVMGVVHIAVIDLIPPEFSEVKPGFKSV